VPFAGNRHPEVSLERLTYDAFARMMHRSGCHFSPRHSEEPTMTTMRLAMFAMFVLPMVLAMTWPTTVHGDAEMTAAAKQYLTTFIDKLRPLDVAANRAWWDANITGKDEDFTRKEKIAEHSYRFYIASLRRGIV